MGVMHHAASAVLMVTPTPVAGHHHTGFVSAHSSTAPLHSADSKLVKKKKKKNAIVRVSVSVSLWGLAQKREKKKKKTGSQV